MAVVVLVVLAATGSKSTGKQPVTGAPPAANPTLTDIPAATPLQSTPAPTPAPTPAGVPVGMTVPTTTGETYQVITFKQNVRSNNEFHTPPPGGSFAAAQVKQCAGPSTPSSANPYGWKVSMSDFSQVTGESTDLLDVPGASLNVTSLQPGQCVAGWVAFTIPGGVTPKQISLSKSDFFWVLP